MTHCTYRSRVRVGHQTATGPVTPTCSWDRWGRAETERTALGEALVLRRRTRVRFPPPPPLGFSPRSRIRLTEIRVQEEPAGHPVGSGRTTGLHGRLRLLTAIHAARPSWVNLSRSSGPPRPRPAAELGNGLGSRRGEVVDE